MPVCLFVCLLSQFNGSVYSSKNRVKTGHTNHYPEAGHWREIRSALGIWPAAVRTILEAAKEVPNKNGKYRKFIKIGTQYDAWTDYHSLKPVFPDGKTFAYRGDVDNFHVKFRDRDSSNGNRPILLVTDRDSGHGVKIVYTN